MVSTSQDEAPADVEEQVWALEQAYFTAFKEARHDAILALLHDGFLGWPDSEERPIGKQETIGFLKKNYAQPGEWSFEIDQAGIRILGDVVITHYVFKSSWENADGTQQKQSTRITHTWGKEGSHWKILGGMSNVQ